MAKRRKANQQRQGKKAAAKREEDRLKALKETRIRRLKYGAIITFIIAALVFVAFAIGNAPPQYLQCMSPDVSMAEHMHTGVYIGLGNQSDYQFIRIPDNMGITRSCMWVLHTHSSLTDGERTAHYARVHIESPFVHTYTLADMFAVWGYAGGLSSNGSTIAPLGAPVYFSNTGISTYRGHVSVYVYSTDMETFPSPGPEDAQYLYSGDVRQVPLNDMTFVYIHLEWPFQNIGGSGT